MLAVSGWQTLPIYVPEILEIVILLATPMLARKTIIRNAQTNFEMETRKMKNLVLELSAKEGENLSEVADLIEDGALEHIAAYDTLETELGGTIVMGSGMRSTKRVIIEFKGIDEDEAIAEQLKAAALAIVKDKAHIDIRFR